MTQGSNYQDEKKDDPAKSGALIQLSDFNQRHPNRCLFDVRDYWNKQRKGMDIPYKSNIEAAGIGQSVDYAFIAERIARGIARFRLSGQHLHKFMGMEVRGLPLASILRISSRDEFSKILESVFDTPQIAEFYLIAPSEYARPQMTARMLLLPLKSDLGDVTRILGCLITSGETGQTPRRFDLERYELSPVIAGGEVVSPKPTASPPVPRSPVFDPSTKTSVIATSTPEQRRKGFTVISDNKKI